MFLQTGFDIVKFKSIQLLIVQVIRNLKRFSYKNESVLELGHLLYNERPDDILILETFFPTGIKAKSENKALMCELVGVFLADEFQWRLRRLAGTEQKGLYVSRQSLSLYCPDCAPVCLS